MVLRIKSIFVLILLSTVLCCGYCVTAQAGWHGMTAEPVYSLVVYTVDGGRAAYAFSDRPEMTIQGTTFRVSSTMADAEYAATDIVRFTLEEGDGQPAYDNFWLVVYTRDGHVDGYAFGDRPEVRMTDELFYVVGADRTVAYAYPGTNIERFTIEDHFAGDTTPQGGVATAVDKPRAGTPADADGDARPQLRLSPGTVSLDGLQSGSAVAVYDSGGRIAMSTAADGDGSLRLSLESLRPGVYVVRTGKMSFKVIRK